MEQATVQASPEMTVTWCDHQERGYSIAIEIENRHVDMRSYHYDHRPGNRTSVTIFDLQPRQIIDLAARLLDVTSAMS